MNESTCLTAFLGPRILLVRGAIAAREPRVDSNQGCNVFTLLTYSPIPSFSLSEIHISLRIPLTGTVAALARNKTDCSNWPDHYQFVHPLVRAAYTCSLSGRGSASRLLLWGHRWSLTLSFITSSHLLQDKRKTRAPLLTSA